MELKKLTNKNLITLNSDLTSKLEIIDYLINQLYTEGKITSIEGFKKAVLDREELSATGMDGGLAIPHGKSDTVKEASFAVVTLNNIASDWESVVETNEVKYVFLLAIPAVDKEGTQMELLADLMTKMSNSDYTSNLYASKTTIDFYNNLDFDVNKQVAKKFDKSIVAVTACPAGIAHTYMAAEALIKAGNEMGVSVFVEKQGSKGIEDKHTNEMLRNADAAIFAVDVSVKNPDRFKHLPLVKTSVAAPLHDAKGIIEKALRKAESEAKGEYVEEEEVVESLGSLTRKAILTGISFMVPLIIAGGMMLTFAVLFKQAFNLQDLYATEGSWLFIMRRVGTTLLGTLMVPVMSAYMAYSLADKPGLAPGFAAGGLANLLGGGFLLGMFGGLFAGFLMRWMKNNIKIDGPFSAFVTFWVYPVVSTFIVYLVVGLLFGGPITMINDALISFLNGLQGGNAAILGIALGIMVSFDLGGPVNKAAYAFTLAAMQEGVYMPYAVFASVKMVSAFGVSLATLPRAFKSLWQEDEIEVGTTTWILGLAGITEGAIPLMVNDPLRVIPSLCVGSAVTGAIVAVANVGLNTPGAGIFSLFFLFDSAGVNLSNIDNVAGQFTPALIWFFAAVLGAIISAAILVATRKAKLNKQNKAMA